MAASHCLSERDLTAAVLTAERPLGPQAAACKHDRCIVHSRKVTNAWRFWVGSVHGDSTGQCCEQETTPVA